MYCNNCGKEIDDKAFVCPHCGVKTNSISKDDGSIGGLGILCFIIPIVGLVLYITWQNNKPIKAKGAGKSALWGFIVGIVLYLIIVGISVVPGIKTQASNSNRQYLEGDLNNLASSALAFYKTPTTHGGGGNSWTSDVDNVGDWLNPYSYNSYSSSYSYSSSTNTLTTVNGSFYLSINRDILTIEGTGIKIGSDGTNAVQATIKITGSTSNISTTINN